MNVYLPYVRRTTTHKTLAIHNVLGRLYSSIFCFMLMMTSSNGNIFRVTGPLCGEFTGPGEFPTQRPVTRSFDVFFDLRLNKRLNKQPWGWWFETPSRSLWRHCNVTLRNPFVMLRAVSVPVTVACLRTSNKPIPPYATIPQNPASNWY